MAEPGTVKNLVRALGGAEAVGPYLGVGLVAVRNWQSWDRIPPQHYLRLAELGEAMLVAVDPALFAKTPRDEQRLRRRKRRLKENSNGATQEA